MTPPESTVGHDPQTPDSSRVKLAELRSSGRSAPVGTALTSKSMFWNTAFNIATFVAISASGFFVTPFVLRRVGGTSFGIYSLGITLTGLVALLDFGLGVATMKMISDRADDGDVRETERLVSSVFGIYSLLGIAFTAVGISVGYWGAGLFHIPAAHVTEFRLCICLSALTIGVTFPQSLYTAILNGRRDYAVLNIVVLSTAAATIVSTVTLLEAGFSIVSVFASGLVISFLQYGAKAWIASRRHGLKVRRASASRRVLQSVVPLASWLLIVNVGTKIILDLDVLVAGLVLGPLAVAAYQVATSLGMVIRRSAEQLNVITLTAGSALWSRRDYVRLRALFLEVNRVTAVILFPAFALTCIVGPRFLDLWVGRSVGQRAASSLIVLAAAMAIISVQASSAQVLVAVGRQRMVAITTASEAGVNILLSVVLAHFFGVVGIAVGTLIPSVLTTVTIFVRTASRSLSLSISEMSRELWPISIQVAVVVIAGRLAAGALVNHAGMVEVLLLAASVYFIWVAANIFAPKQSRQRYAGALRGRGFAVPSENAA